MTQLDWEWFYLCMIELALFIGAGFASLRYRGLWIKERLRQKGEQK